MALFGRFTRKSDPVEDVRRMVIKGWVEASLGADPPLTLTISEIDCGEPACPGFETIILVMREGEATQAVKVKKPMGEVREADVRDAVKFL
jgi:hypothetical protein